jgi:hypothetical protein
MDALFDSGHWIVHSTMTYSRFLKFLCLYASLFSSSCPDPSILSPFKYNRLSGSAEASLYSMFKFPDSNRVHFQCDIVICKGACAETDCDEALPEARSLKDPRLAAATKAEALLQATEEGSLMASYSVFVLEPGERVGELE